MMKITGLSHLFKWENLHNWWLTKYFFAPLYIHIVLQILSRQSHQLFLYAIIFKLLSMMHFCYSQFRSEIAHVDEFSTRNMKALFMIEEN